MYNHSICLHVHLLSDKVLMYRLCVEVSQVWQNPLQMKLSRQVNFLLDVKVARSLFSIFIKSMLFKKKLS